MHVMKRGSSLYGCQLKGPLLIEPVSWRQHGMLSAGTRLRLWKASRTPWLYSVVCNTELAIVDDNLAMLLWPQRSTP